MKIAGVSFEELVLTINDTALYSMGDLRKDLKEIKKSFQTMLESDFKLEEEKSEVPETKELVSLDKNYRIKLINYFKMYFEIKNKKKPIWESYLTLIKGTSNKFHYFGIMLTDNKEYAVANLYGKIGVRQPRVVELSITDNKVNAINLAKKKIKGKLSKGYDQSIIEN